MVVCLAWYSTLDRVFGGVICKRKIVVFAWTPPFALGQWCVRRCVRSCRLVRFRVADVPSLDLPDHRRALLLPRDLFLVPVPVCEFIPLLDAMMLGFALESSTC